MGNKNSSKKTSNKISALASQVSELQTEGKQALAQLQDVNSQVQSLRSMMDVINSTTSEVKEEISDLATDVSEIKKDIADIQEALKIVHQDHEQEIAQLNHISTQLTWSTMVLQIAEPAQRIESMYSFLSRLSLGSKTAARWFIRDVLSPTTGVLEAMISINNVLTGKVVVDPQQGSMLLQFKDTLEKSGLSSEEQKSAKLSYFNSLAYLQIKGIIILVNAFRAVGDNAMSVTYVKEIRLNLFKQYTLLYGNSFTLDVVGVNHGKKRKPRMSEDTISVNGEVVRLESFDNDGKVVANPFKGFRVTVLPIFDPYVTLRSQYFDTTTDEGQTAMSQFLAIERDYALSTILVIASTGPAGNTINDDLAKELKHIIGDGFKGLSNDTLMALAATNGETNIMTAPQSDIIVRCSAKLELDPNYPDKIQFEVRDNGPKRVMSGVPSGLLGASSKKSKDVLIRTGPKDKGKLPYKGKAWLSPDILSSGEHPLPNPSILESKSSYKSVDTITRHGYVNNVTNNIYVRLRNMSKVEVEVKVRLYSAAPNVNNIPSKFVSIPAVKDDDYPDYDEHEVVFKMAPGAIRVTPRPFLWNPKGAKHICLYAMVGTPSHPLPVLSKVKAGDIVPSENRHIAQRKISLENADQEVLEKVVAAAVDLDGIYRFELDYNQIPVGSSVLIESNSRADITASTVADSSSGFIQTDPVSLKRDWYSSITCRVKATAGSTIADGASLVFKIFQTLPQKVMTRSDFAAAQTSESMQPTSYRLVGVYNIVAVSENITPTVSGGLTSAAQNTLSSAPSECFTSAVSETDSMALWNDFSSSESDSSSSESDSSSFSEN